MRLAAIIAVGLLSRAIHTGWPLFDKYLGDALYAAMIYEILRVTARPSRNRRAAAALAAVCAIECFQLTMIPAEWAASESIAARIAGRLLGTHFSWLDIVAYLVGIVAIRLFPAKDLLH